MIGLVIGGQFQLPLLLDALSVKVVERRHARMLQTHECMAPNVHALISDALLPGEFADVGHLDRVV